MLFRSKRRGIAPGDSKRLDRSRLGREYAAFVAGLRLIGELSALPASEEIAITEIDRLTRTPRSGIHPLRHLTLIAWLFPNFDAFRVAYDAQRLLAQEDQRKIPSTHTVEEINPKRQALLNLIAEGYSISGASRSIGVDPATGMAWAAAAGVETRKRPSILRGDVRDRVVAALARGAEKTEAARLGEISIVSVTRLLRTEVGLRERWRSARFLAAQTEARTRWFDVVNKNPRSGPKAARLLEPAAYAWLYRNDLDWLKAAVAHMDRLTREIGTRVDWDARDRGLSQEVRRVALALVTGAPAAKLRLWHLYQAIPELKAKLSRLDRLPLTAEAIQSVLKRVKSTDEWFDDAAR